MVHSRPRAVVSLSGGMDSAVCAVLAARDYHAYALHFSYGQRTEGRELHSARAIAEALGFQDFLHLKIDLFRRIGGSALTDQIDVPKSRSPTEITHGIPITYVPARNTIFLSFALALAERIEAEDIFFGANQLDYSGYPDCREEYIRAYERMANLATKAGVEGRSRVKIHAPLIHMTKSEIIQKGLDLGVDYGLTWSCYDPTRDGRACGLCDSCQLRLKGFKEAGITDPILYARL